MSNFMIFVGKNKERNVKKFRKTSYRIVSPFKAARLSFMRYYKKIVNPTTTNPSYISLTPVMRIIVFEFFIFIG